MLNSVLRKRIKLDVSKNQVFINLMFRKHGGLGNTSTIGGN